MISLFVTRRTKCYTSICGVNELDSEAKPHKVWYFVHMIMLTGLFSELFIVSERFQNESE